MTQWIDGYLSEPQTMESKLGQVDGDSLHAMLNDLREKVITTEQDDPNYIPMTRLGILIVARLRGIRSTTRKASKAKTTKTKSADASLDDLFDDLD